MAWGGESGGVGFRVSFSVGFFCWDVFPLDMDAMGLRFMVYSKTGGEVSKSDFCRAL